MVGNCIDFGSFPIIYQKRVQMDKMYDLIHIKIETIITSAR